MSEYKLIYFKLRLLGEPIRWMFLVSGVPFEDYEIPTEEWKDYKATTGWGQVPVLEVDGEKISQSQAIGQLLGKRFDLCGDNDLEDARCQEYVTHMHECRVKWLPYYKETDLEKRKTIAENLKSNVFPFYLERFNEVVEKNGGNYLVGKRLTWADLFLVNFLQVWADSINAPNLLDNYPALVKLQERILAIPAIKDRVETRPEMSLYGVNM